MSDGVIKERLMVKRILSAEIETVFEAWTRPEVISQWFGPEGFEVSKSDIDLSVGGKYLIEMHSPDGNSIKHFGEYLEIAHPNRLIFTWELDNQQCQGSEQLTTTTIVTINLMAIGRNKTELNLLHEKLPTQQAYDGHQFGWVSSLDCLEQFLSSN
jgi:uncharacterized protein YndB with AHSA1/START domain